MTAFDDAANELNSIQAGVARNSLDLDAVVSRLDDNDLEVANVQQRVTDLENIVAQWEAPTEPVPDPGPTPEPPSPNIPDGVLVSAGWPALSGDQYITDGYVYFEATGGDVAKYAHTGYAVTPGTTITSGNPMDLNPQPGYQAFISDSYGYRQPVGGSVTLNAGDTLLIGVPLSSGPTTDLMGISVPYSHARLLDCVAIHCREDLTGVENMFRPPYCLPGDWTDITLGDFSVAALDGAGKVYPPGTTPAASTSGDPVADYTRFFERTWMQHGEYSRSRYTTHATECMPNYHREINSVASQGMCLAVCSDIPLADRAALVRGIIQAGIDNSGIARTAGSVTPDRSLDLGLSFFADAVLPGASIVRPEMNQSRHMWMTYNGTDWEGTSRSLWREVPGREFEHIAPAQRSYSDWRSEQYLRIAAHNYPARYAALQAVGALDAYNMHDGEGAWTPFVERWMTVPEMYDVAAQGLVWAYGSVNSDFAQGMWNQRG